MSDVRGADNILAKFKAEREETLLLLSDPHQLVEKLWTHESPLSIDRSCMWRPGSPDSFNQVPRGIRKSHACSQCRHLERLMDLSRFAVGKPFVIEAGALAGKEMIVLSTDASHLSIKTLSQRYLGSVNSCVESDPFTNSILMSWITHPIIEETITQVYTAFVCGNRGYLLEEATQDLEAIEMTPSVVRGITHQLIATLHRLEKHHFIHGRPDMSSLRVIEEPTVFKESDLKVESPVTLKLTAFDRSSIDDRGTRVIPKYHLSGRYVETLSSINLNDEKTQLSEIQLSEAQLETILHLHQTGIPIYSCLEVYLFLLSLLSWDPFRWVFFEQKDLRKLFELMFTPADASDIYMQLEAGSVEGVTLLKGRSLQRNILETLMKALARG